MFPSAFRVSNFCPVAWATLALCPPGRLPVPGDISEDGSREVVEKLLPAVDGAPKPCYPLVICYSLQTGK